MLRLGSTSKTRAMLLDKFGVSFKQEASNFYEDSIIPLIQKLLFMK